MDNILPFPSVARPRPVETALDRLAARLGDAPLSPDVRAGMESYNRRDAAFDKMFHAAMKHDDAAFEAATAEFWEGDAA